MSDTKPRPTVLVRHGSLTDADALVLVNASNTNGLLGSGVSGALRRACGQGFQAKIEEALQATFGGPMTPGDVLVTDAGTHPSARFVAHVAVMDYREGFTGASFPTEQTVARGCQHLWAALERLEVPALSVAMVALGAGTGQLGVRRSYELACQSLTAHLQAVPASRLARVTFWGYELHEYVIAVQVVSRFFALPAGSVPPEVLALAHDD